MTAQNPFNFINPLYIKFPANKTMICPEETQERRETYFNGEERVKEKQRWAYDNYFYRDLPFNVHQKRGDRVNIEVRFANVHLAELKKPVPSSSQSWYGHRLAKGYNPKEDQTSGNVLEKNEF